MWHSLEIKEVLAKLKTSVDGLSGEETSKRLKKFGPNKLPEEKKLTRLQIFFHQFKNPLIFILFAAAIVSLFLNHPTDFGIIIAVIGISTLIGFFQENKANKAISKLQGMVHYKARVLRDGREKVISTEDLVPGDVILLSPGDKVPADARLLELKNLEIIEAALTGESVPSKKQIAVFDPKTPLADRENMVYMGTVVAKGKAKAVVVETGDRSELGRIVSLVKEVEEEKTPLQKQIFHFSKILGLIIFIVVLTIFFVGYLTGRPLLEIFLISVAIAVAAIPEGLLPALTIILAIGMQKILKHKGLVRRMVAAETLGSVSVICSDKTGTLTEGEMRVAHILVWNKKFGEAGSEKEKLLILKIGLLCNNAVVENPEEELHEWKILADPTEKALFLAGAQAGLEKDVLEEKMPRLGEIPFDAEYKYMATLHLNGGDEKKNERIIYVKGAPEKILQMSSFINIDGRIEKFSEARRQEVREKLEEVVGRGLRCLAFGYREMEEKQGPFIHEDLRDLVFVGFAALKDPLRAEAGEAVALCQSAGIRPVIVTGDHKLTAKAIVEELGLKVGEENILEGNDLDGMTDEDLARKVENFIIYARVEPKHKLRIINAWQKRGEVVAMTGDGVNDAPALKSADIGIALGSGTDVAKETSDLILLDNNFHTIVEAVKRGRIIFNNIRSVVLYLISGGFTEMIVVGGAVILGFPLPLLPAQILWIKLIEDATPAMALAFEEGDPKGVMKEAPRKINESIFSREMKWLIGIYAAVMDFSLFGLFVYFWKTTGNLDYARTIVFIGLGIASLFYIYSVRSLEKSVIHVNPFSNKFLVFSTILGIILMFTAIYVPFFQNILKTVPLGVGEWLLLGAYALLSLALIEFGKWFFIIRRKKLVSNP